MELEGAEAEAVRASRVELLMSVARDTAASLQLVSTQLQAELAEVDRERRLATEVQALRDELAQLRAGLPSRAVIDQAKGVLMARCGCDADTAFEMLCTVSRTERRKVRDVAATVVRGTLGPLGQVATPGDSPGSEGTVHPFGPRRVAQHQESAYSTSTK